MSPLFRAVVLGATLWFAIPSLVEAQREGRVPDYARVSVTDNRVRLEFRWSTAPGFGANDAVEFSVITESSDQYIMPPNGDDRRADTGYAVSPNFPSSYRDVYNYTRPVYEDIYGGLVGCGFEPNGDTASVATALHFAILRAADSALQATVGSFDADAFVAHETYWFEYLVDRIPGGNPYAYASIRHDAVNSTWCALTTGDAVGTFLPFVPHDSPPLWLNRLCVPTSQWAFTPGHVGSLVNGGTVCADCDADGLFSIQPLEMYGTNTGDCDDSSASSTILGICRTRGDSCGNAVELCDNVRWSSSACLTCQNDSDCGPSRCCDGVHRCVLCTSESNRCGDGVDNDADARTDCADTDCTLAPACEALAGCPGGLSNGAYCALNPELEGCYEGGSSDLLMYRNGTVTRLATCSGGCVVEASGTPDRCSVDVEVCNSIDDDSDSRIDEGFGCIRGRVESRGCTCSGGTESRTCNTSCVWSNWVGCNSPVEACDGLDNDCDGITDEPDTCWRAVYRWRDAATGARCYGLSDTLAPVACSTHRALDQESFIISSVSLPGTFRAVQCSRMTDHIIVEVDSSDYSALLGSHDCTYELGYIFRTAPQYTTPFARACPIYRFSYSATTGGSHLFTLGGDDLTGQTCEPPHRGVGLTSAAACFSGVPSCCSGTEPVQCL